jgi:3-methyladenine DNA glycosylase AlkC
MDSPSTKPLLWSKIILKDSKFNSNVNEIFDKMIDPRLIYLDKNLTEENISECKKKN